MQVVLDANVIISGLFWKQGNPRKIIEMSEFELIEILFSKGTLKELSDVLEKHFKTPKNEIEDILKFLLERSSVVGVKSSVNICKDKDDNKFLELAVDGNANYIISGDRHLLEIKEFKGIKILRPSQFLKRIKW